MGESSAAHAGNWEGSCCPGRFGKASLWPETGGRGTGGLGALLPFPLGWAQHLACLWPLFIGAAQSGQSRAEVGWSQGEEFGGRGEGGSLECQMLAESGLGQGWAWSRRGSCMYRAEAPHTHTPNPTCVPRPGVGWAGGGKAELGLLGQRVGQVRLWGGCWATAL